MIQPPTGNDAIEEALGHPILNAREGAPPRALGEPGALGARLALCWLFPMSSGPPHLLRPRSVIGRADDCDVCLVGRAVSRHHAQIEHSDAGTVLTDLRSTNGVFLNGVGVTDSPVAAGDLLRVGNWVGCFTAGETGSQNPGQVREVGPDIWGGDAFARALEPMRSAACSRLPLTLVGESGTGKQLLARAVHAWSGRRGPFHTLNCATSSERHIVTELFGRRTRGARAQQSQGLLHATQGGTLLLEDASELSPALQTRLLRLLTPSPDGGDGESERFDVRLIVTRQHHRAGRSRIAKASAVRDASLELWLPPLRQRVPEIPALFSHFVQRYSTAEPFALDAELVEALCLYSWPGNVRELEFLARQLVALHHGARELGREHLPRRILDAVKRGAHGTHGLTLVDAARSTIPAVPTSGRRPHPLEPAG
jgi:hypothetical protein